MSAKSLGTLTLDLVARIGGFVDGLTKAEREMDKRTKEMERKAKQRAQAVQKAFAGIATAVSAAGAAAAMKIIIDNTKEFEQVQKQLAAALQSTEHAAGYSQGKLNDLGAAMAKVTTFSTNDISRAQTVLLGFTNIVGEQLPEAMKRAADFSARTGASLASAAETMGRALDVPSEGMRSLQRQGFKFSESQIEAARQLERTGRIAEAQAIVMQELDATYGGAAKAARDTFGGAVEALKNKLGDLLTGRDGSLNEARKGVEDLIAQLDSPSTQAAFANITQMVITLAGWLVKAAEGFNVVKSAAEEMARKAHGAAADDVAGLERQLERQKKALAEQKKNQTTYLQVRGGLRLIGAKETEAKLQAEIDSTQAKISEFYKWQEQQTKGQTTPSQAPDLPVTHPRIVNLKDHPATSGGGRGRSDLRAIHNAFLADLKRATAQELDILQERQQRLDLLQEQGLVSVKDLYAERVQLEQDSLRARLAGMDAEIAAQQQFAQASTDGRERVMAQTRLNDLYAERNRLQRQGAQDLEKLQWAGTQAMKALQNDAEQVNIQFLEMHGKLGLAAKLGADLASYEPIRRFEVNGLTDAAKQAQALADVQAAQGRLNELKREFGLINERLGMAEARLALARQTGTLSDIQAMGEASRLRKRAIAQLEHQLGLYLAMKDAATTPEIVQAVERIKLELEGLKATAEPLAQSFQDMFQGSFEDAFASIVTGAQNAKDAFKSMADSIVQQITRMAAQQIASGIFGAGGPAGGIGGMIAGMFGYAQGSAYIANDQVALLHKGERVLTAEENRKFTAGAGSSMTVQNTFVLQNPASRQTQQQVAAAAGQAVQRAQARNT